MTLKDKLAATPMSNAQFEALHRLARSSWGKQGTGGCPRRVLRRWLTQNRFARSANRRGDDAIMTLTIQGFRALHAELVNRSVRP
jgi:hypothetical protein